jgi:hypothetical protein
LQTFIKLDHAGLLRHAVCNAEDVAMLASLDVPTAKKLSQKIELKN